VATPTSLVLDVDTGVDDALALLLAATHPGLDLRAVTCVDGNAPVDQVVVNTLTVLDAAGRSDVPVAPGADRPLAGAVPDHPAPPRRHAHGRDGMGDLDWPRSPRTPDARTATTLLYDVLHRAAQSGEQVTVVACAPLTNLAALVEAHPRTAAAGVGRLIVVGGTTGRGNAGPTAEFNLAHDPAAASAVLAWATARRVPLTLYGLDVFFDVRLSRAHAVDLVDTAGRRRLQELAGRLLQFQCDRADAESASSPGSGTIGDAGAVCAALDPAGITTAGATVSVERSGEERGRTQMDFMAPAPRHPVEVALEVDGPRYARLWLSTVSSRSGPRPGGG
jgi:pyrimidine-specific ribonucleoside hydrolase